MKISIKSEIREVMATCTEVPRSEIPRRAMLALNLAIRRVNKSAKGELSKSMGLNPGQVSKALKVFQARGARLIARLEAKGQAIPLRSFRQVRQRSKGAVSGAYGQRKEYPHTFEATMKSGHKGIFRRLKLPTGKRVHRLKIIELWGPAVPTEFSQVKANQIMERIGRKEFMAEFNRLMRLGSRLQLRGGSSRVI